MYTNTGYYYQKDIDIENTSRPLLVANSGMFRLKTRPLMRTWRPEGRKDYQLLYIASGKASFYFPEVDGTCSHTPTILQAGEMVLYRPNVPQHYSYHREDQTEVFWVHFTGSEVSQILSHYGFSENLFIFSPGICPELSKLFLQMITELQLRRPYLEDCLACCLHQIFLLTARRLKHDPSSNFRIQKEVEHAIHFFHEHYNTSISVEEYAASQHMSVCWFIRIFKKYTGQTPLQYITEIRITRAQELLENTDYNISEIGSIVGYDNPLYFSRIFKKAVGISPKEYRR